MSRCEKGFILLPVPDIKRIFHTFHQNCIQLLFYNQLKINFKLFYSSHKIRIASHLHFITVRVTETDIGLSISTNGDASPTSVMADDANTFDTFDILTI